MSAQHDDRPNRGDLLRRRAAVAEKMEPLRLLLAKYDALLTAMDEVEQLEADIAASARPAAELPLLSSAEPHLSRFVTDNPKATVRDLVLATIYYCGPISAEEIRKRLVEAGAAVTKPKLLDKEAGGGQIRSNLFNERRDARTVYSAHGAYEFTAAEQRADVARRLRLVPTSRAVVPPPPSRTDDDPSTSP